MNHQIGCGYEVAPKATLAGNPADLDADVGDGEVEPPLEAALLADMEDLAVEGVGPRGHAVVAHYPALQWKCKGQRN